MAWTAVFLVLSSVLVLGGLVAVSDQEVDFEAESRADELNTTQIQMNVHERVNEVRGDRGISQLEYSPRISAQATNHTEWMANTTTLNHTSNEYYTCRRGENIAYTYAGIDVETGWGETVNHNYNETKIGEYLVEQWMHSPPHRENLLDEQYVSQGIGIAAVEVGGTTRVYATQALCVAEST